MKVNKRVQVRTIQVSTPKLKGKPASKPRLVQVVTVNRPR